jgi:putative acetyltransferase
MTDQPDLNEVILRYQKYLVRPWKPEDRDKAAEVVRACLAEYGLAFERHQTDKDAVDVEEHYWKNKRGEFWVCEESETGLVIGTAGYYEIGKGSNAVEIRKMFILRHARGKGLGKAILEKLERRIKEREYNEIHIQTATVLKAACQLYRSSGYWEIERDNKQKCEIKMKKLVADILPA